MLTDPSTVQTMFTCTTAPVNPWATGGEHDVVVQTATESGFCAGLRVLVTNDDGIESEGLRVLARAFAAAGHDVVVVAPDRDYSGTGAALGNIRPDTLPGVRRVAIENFPREAWALQGPPALTVVAAHLGAFGPRPHVVVSGINAGLNTGRSILHSGTLGAALTARNFGVSALAVSVDAGERWHWDTAAALAVETLPRLVDAPPRSVLNLNSPARPRHAVPGVRWARLAPFGAVRAAASRVADDRLQFELTDADFAANPHTAQGTVEAGWAALTALVGVAEAWPDHDAVPAAGLDVHPRLVPGAEVHHVHRIPDASVRSNLRQPVG